MNSSIGRHNGIADFERSRDPPEERRMKFHSTLKVSSFFVSVKVYAETMSLDDLPTDRKSMLRASS